MMEDTLCVRYESAGTIAAFAANALPADVVEQFERHLVACPRCQREVRVATAIRAGLSRTPSTRPAALRRRVATVAGLALAASVVAIVMGRSDDERALQPLGDVGVPPAYAGVAVRRDAVAAESLFDAGMSRYVSGDIEGARALLNEARARGSDSVPTSFFLGVASLLVGDESTALQELQFVWNRAPNAYAAEAHYYAAKAWLRRANADSALAHLQSAAAIAGPFAATARALADTVLEVRR